MALLLVLKELRELSRFHLLHLYGIEMWAAERILTILGKERCVKQSAGRR